jgi:hypothetical protein
MSKMSQRIRLEGTDAEPKKHRRQHHNGAAREAWQKRKRAANAARGNQRHVVMLDPISGNYFIVYGRVLA